MNFATLIFFTIEDIKYKLPSIWHTKFSQSVGWCRCVFVNKCAEFLFKSNIQLTFQVLDCICIVSGPFPCILSAYLT